MKILGFHMSGRPNVSAHVEAIRKRFRQRYWILFHLKRFGFNIIRPVANYCCVVYNLLLTDE